MMAIAKIDAKQIKQFKHSKNLKDLGSLICIWYLSAQRDLPWRRSKDPYKIWISEVMLQQTLSKSVEKFYERFTNRFPTVQELSRSPLEEVYKYWSGLGYYNRAKNLHKSAQIIAVQGFPKTAEALRELPGFGPYTSRAVASLAFNQKVGVLDGNVIRVLCRVFGLSLPWWKTTSMSFLQSLSDEMASFDYSHKNQRLESGTLNQALMELGATVCTPQKPFCFACPWKLLCVAFKESKTSDLPLKKPRPKTNMILWKVRVFRKKDQIGLVENNYAPFLRNHLIFPGSIEKLNVKPKSFELKHKITHHDIYIRFIKKVKYSDGESKIQWMKIKQLKERSPSSLMQKILFKNQQFSRDQELLNS
jgi:A/G-specific adenine glycosylase